MSELLDLVRSGVVVAPLGGGPSTPDLVIAGARAGCLGFLAGAYKPADQVAAEIAAVRAAVSAPFGVNLFVPGTPATRPEAVTGYVAALESEGYAVAAPAWDDDGWDAKLDGLVRAAPAVVTFTFGAPEREVIEALRARGCIVGVTVTTPAEARRAAAVGAAFVCVQGPEAGGHRATFDAEQAPGARPLLQLLADVRAAVDLPLLAAGGIMTASAVRAALDAGAAAAMCGTAFLRCPESAARADYKDALADPRYRETVITRAFSGRYARGLANRFAGEHPDAPAGYPEINNATRPLRAAGGAETMSLWAGTGWRHAEARPVADVLDRLVPT